MGPGAALSDPSSLDRDTSGNHGEGEEGWGRGGALVFFVSCVRSPGASTETKRHESGKAERPLVLPALELRDISNHTGFFFFLAKTKHWHSQEGQVGPGSSAGSGERARALRPKGRPQLRAKLWALRESLLHWSG